ncbi:helix-turn-helix domain-containing protein [Enterococcus sp. 5H]|uniref:helix-turn-helix domain-containing protein n=1 Tax=Enterococcus sp. 5H TaxID=1229490 RepID=UPI002302AB7F|nr:helix-turn-helix domain-containing protein [Enterococcus sp. 5H]MDA9471610.1 hypothetical protein [Enterococcus sp. 5H]
MNTTQLQLLVNTNNKRWFQILANLERSSSLSTKELANLLESSPRTITSNISEIKTYFEQTASITSSTNGFTLTINDKVAYLDKKKELLEYEPILTILSGIFYGDQLSIFEWADRSYLSDRTLISYLKKVEPILEHYQLNINYQSLLFIEGKEIDIRNFFLVIFYEEDTLPHFILPSILINNVVSNLSMTEFNYLHLNVPHYKLAYLLFITYQRISLGYELKISDDIIDTLLNSNLANAMQELKLSFEKQTELDLPSSDLAYLMLILLDSGSYDDKLLLSSTNSRDLDAIFSPLIHDFCKELDITMDTLTKNYLQSFFHLYYLKNEASPTCLFFPPSVTNYFETNYQSELKTLKELLSNYPDGFWHTTPAKFENNLLLASIRLIYKSTVKHVNIAFLFEGPTEVTTVLEELTHMYIPSNHTLYFFHAHTLLEEEIDRLSIQLVVTNFSEYIFDLPKDVHYLLFSYIPTAADWNKLVQYIDPRVSKKYKTTFSVDIDI